MCNLPHQTSFNETVRQCFSALKCDWSELRTSAQLSISNQTQVQYLRTRPLGSASTRCSRKSCSLVFGTPTSHSSRQAATRSAASSSTFTQRSSVSCTSADDKPNAAKAATTIRFKSATCHFKAQQVTGRVPVSADSRTSRAGSFSSSSSRRLPTWR